MTTRKPLLGLAALAVAICGTAGMAKPAAAQVLTTHRIPAALALEAVAAAVEACAKQGYAETAVLVDADGVPEALLRGDSGGAHSLDSATYKAYTSASFKANSSQVAARAAQTPSLAALLAKLPKLVASGGGVVIKMDKEVIGAIGAGGAPGGDLDEACAKAGLDKIRDRLK
jgi:uncharacterized protein GlcG (DUF336 family)